MRGTGGDWRNECDRIPQCRKADMTGTKISTAGASKGPISSTPKLRTTPRGTIPSSYKSTIR